MLFTRSESITKVDVATKFRLIVYQPYSYCKLLYAEKSFNEYVPPNYQNCAEGKPSKNMIDSLTLIKVKI